MYRQKHWPSVYKNKWWPVCILTLLVLSGCNSGTSGPATPTTTAQYMNIDTGLPYRALSAPVLAALPDNTPLHIGVTFKIDPTTLDRLGKSSVRVGDNNNAAATQAGIDDNFYQQVKKFFAVDNAVLHLSRSRTYLTIDMKAGAAAHLFQTKFVKHTLTGQNFFASDINMTPKLPTGIANKVLAVTGLESYGSEAVSYTDSTSQATGQAGERDAKNCTFTAGTVLPAQIAHAYGYDHFWEQGWHGENMTINLVELGGYDSKDVNTYFSCVNFTGQLDTVNVDSSKPAASKEATMDIGLIAGLAPAAHIVAYQTSKGNFTRINDMLQRIYDDNIDSPGAGSAISISLQASEKGVTRPNKAAIDQSLALLANAEHMSIFAASGDCGAFASEIYKDLTVSFPASDPSVVAVGGTMLTLNDQQERKDEVVWSDGSNTKHCNNRWGSGGGLSRGFTLPTWQVANGIENQYTNGKRRQVPDVAAVATNLPVYFQGQWISGGGTSAATPIWAAGFALVNQAMLAQKQVYYNGPAVFYDVTNKAENRTPYFDVVSGDNLYYPATPGWDFASGLGTPNLPDFFNILLESTK